MFKVNDLYVSLTSPSPFTNEEECGGDAQLGQLLVGRVGDTTGCCGGGGGNASEPGHWHPILVQFTGIDPDSETFVLLKDYLTVTIKKIQARELAMEQGQMPETMADVEMLEGKLNEALKELRVRKTDLQQKADQQ